MTPGVWDVVFAVKSGNPSFLSRSNLEPFQAELRKKYGPNVAIIDWGANAANTELTIRLEITGSQAPRLQTQNLSGVELSTVNGANSQEEFLPVLALVLTALAIAATAYFFSRIVADVKEVYEQVPPVAQIAASVTPIVLIVGAVIVVYLVYSRPRPEQARKVKGKFLGGDFDYSSRKTT